MAGESDQQSYEQLFKQFSDLVERWLIRLTCMLIALLICVQALLQIPAVRTAITRVDVLEGKPYSDHREHSKHLR